MDNLKLPIFVLLCSFSLLGFTSLGYLSASTAAGVYCEDCGNETNCWQGNGLSDGYQGCQVNYDSNGNATGCDLSAWGDCQRLHQLPPHQE